MKRFKILSFVLILTMLATLTIGLVPVMSESVVVNQSKELKVVGNKIVWAEDETHKVYLSGLSVYAYDLTKESVRMDRSIIEAYDNWHVNLIRFPITMNVWNDPSKKATYQELLAKYVKEAEKRGKYILIDLHNFGFITQADVDFWKECAVLYKNNPSVIFGLLNEPHDISWEQWRNGGESISTNKEGETVKTRIFGHQELVEIIRDLGAKNILLAGGLDWGYDLRGLVGEGLTKLTNEGVEGRIITDNKIAEVDTKKYFLVDQGSNNNLSKAGNGIIYDTHIYPTKGMKEWSELENRDSVDPCEYAAKHWAVMTGSARKLFPVLSGENGWDTVTMKGIFDSYIKDRTEMLMAMFEPGEKMYHDRWVPALYKYFYDESYGEPMHTTSWCFAPNSSPVLIEDKAHWKEVDYSYPVSPYWGAYVKDELKRLLGENLVTGKKIIDANGFDDPTLAIDADYTTMATKPKKDDRQFITIDLGKEYIIKKWAVRHSGSMLYSDQSKNTVDFKLMYSNDNKAFKVADTVIGNTAPVTEREINPITARYVRLHVDKASQIDEIIRICDFAVFGDYAQDVSKVPTMDKAFMQINYNKDGETVIANVNYPFYNTTETDKEYTIVVLVCSKDNKLESKFPPKVYKKTVPPSTSEYHLDDITLNFDIKLPNDADHYFKIIRLDNGDKVAAFKYNTIVR